LPSDESLDATEVEESGIFVRLDDSCSKKSTPLLNMSSTLLFSAVALALLKILARSKFYFTHKKVTLNGFLARGTTGELSAGDGGAKKFRLNESSVVNDSSRRCIEIVGRGKSLLISSFASSSISLCKASGLTSLKGLIVGFLKKTRIATEPANKQH
jgi:hypothetical protein